MAGLLSDLRDFGQGASNAAASTVSGPLDLLAMLMRKAGIPVPQNSFGGSEWMAQKGLTAQPKNRTAGLLGEAAGLISPIVAQAKAPQIARGLLQAGENAAKPRTLPTQLGAIVWHGSPHKFDKFDSSKIGTGEGAQAYGHGLYLAEDARVAGSYQDKLSGALPTEIAAGGKALDFRSAAAEAFGDEAADALIKSGAHMKPEAWGAVADALRAKGVKDARPLAGSLYKVDLPDSAIARMLDWDKPLSQQAPEVRAAAESLGIGKPYLAGMPARQIEAQGMDVYNDLSKLTLGPKTLADAEAAKRLRELGIPGIRYLDGGSRGTGAGTSNFVVFPGEESILRILERNGVAF